MIISDGYNGAPTGFDNRCEDEDGLTNWYVLHAEANAIKLLDAQSCSGNALYYFIALPAMHQTDSPQGLFAWFMAKPIKTRLA